MPMDPLPIWEEEFEKVSPKLSSPTGTKELADYIAARVDAKLTLDQSLVLFSPVPPFQWQKKIFLAQILALSKFSLDPITPRIQLALAWQSATLACLPMSLGGAAMNPPPPGTNGISGPGVATISPAGVAQGFSIFQKELLAAPNSETAGGSKIPEACRKAFEKVSYTIIGVDTKPPPVGPIPYAFPLVKII